MANIAVFIEQRDGAFKKVAWQMISQARKLADASGGEVWGVLLGGDPAAAAALAGKHGAHRLFAAGDQLERYDSERYGTALATFCRTQKPDLVLIGATALGRDLGPTAAAKLGCACISDAIALKFEGGAWEVRRPIYAGKCFVDVVPKTAPAIVGIRPNAFVAQDGGGAAAAVTAFDAGQAQVTPRAIVREIVGSDGGRVELTEADIVVSGGRGIKGPENYVLIEELAAALNAAAGASRAVVDAGWVDYSHQVGQTGKTVGPNLYIACGISGAIQHLAGMSSSKCIVAINKDPAAPIFKVADFGVVGDLFEVLPALTKAVKEIRG
ncbi:MAG: electron transfer flavoprotein subunit alpha/FixB family protein [bacterium]|nr:electron transfer flavoprotein subunit alpha/FixB family protein [bacterium]